MIEQGDILYAQMVRDFSDHIDFHADAYAAENPGDVDIQTRLPLIKEATNYLRTSGTTITDITVYLEEGDA